MCRSDRRLRRGQHPVGVGASIGACGDISTREMPVESRDDMQEGERKVLSRSELCSPQRAAEGALGSIDSGDDGRWAGSGGHPWTLFAGEVEDLVWSPVRGRRHVAAVVVPVRAARDADLDGASHLA